MIDKFRSLAGAVLSPARVERLEEVVLGLEDLADARTLEAMLLTEPEDPR